MKTTKRFFSLLIALVMTLTLAACSSETETAPAPAESNSSNTEAVGTEESSMPTEGIPDNYVLRMSAGTMTGTYYQFNITANDLVDQYADGWMIAPTITSGSAEGLALVEAGELDTVCASAISWACCIDGVYAYDHPYNGREMQFIQQCAPEVLHICCKGDAEYETLEDLKGKKVSLNIPGSANYCTVMRLFDDMEIDPYEWFDVVDLSPTDAITALADGTIECYVWFGGIGGNPAQVAESTTGLKLLSLTEEQQATLLENEPYCFAYTIPAGTYKGVDTDVVSVNDMQIVVATEDVPENVIYQYVKICAENLDDIVAVNQNFATANPEDTAAWWGRIKWHPGAEKYYRELGLISD